MQRSCSPGQTRPRRGAANAVHIRNLVRLVESRPRGSSDKARSSSRQFTHSRPTRKVSVSKDFFFFTYFKTPRDRTVPVRTAQCFVPEEQSLIYTTTKPGRSRYGQNRRTFDPPTTASLHAHSVPPQRERDPGT